MHFSEHLANCFELAVYFSFLQPTVFINRDYFGNEGYTTVEICLMPGAAYRLRRSGVVRLYACLSGIQSERQPASQTVCLRGRLPGFQFTVEQFCDFSKIHKFSELECLQRQSEAHEKSCENSRGSQLFGITPASADQGWFLSPLYYQCSAE